MSDAQGIGGRLARCAKCLMMLIGAHAWMGLHVAVAMNGLLGAMYFAFPPLALLALGLQLERFAAFALATAGVWLLLSALLVWTFRRRLVVLPLSAWLLLAPVPLAWLPVASGELVRTAAMRTALLQAGADCHATSSLMASLHRWGEHSPSHAWMVVDGASYIWSYSEMRFVPDVRHGPAAGCPTR